jgi:hypothetical protein
MFAEIGHHRLMVRELSQEKKKVTCNELTILFLERQEF